MQEIFQKAVTELRDGEPVVVATVIRTKGSTPQKAGSKLLVRSDGTGIGPLGGGCVEGDIWFAAKELLKRGGSTQYRDYQLNEALAAQDGLVCGGTMYFLIDPVYHPDEYLLYAKEINDAFGGGPSVALATLINPDDTMSTTLGSRLFIRQDGTTDGTLGSPEIDRHAVTRGHELMVHGESDYVALSNGTEYFIEAYTTPPQIILCGGGHVSKAITGLAKNLGFRVFVTDDRKEFANKDRFPEADILVPLSPPDALDTLPVNPNTFIIIATRGHRYDNVALLAAAKTPAKYVGLLGSLRKTILIYEDLLKSDLPIERIREIRSPIGLDIHARTPEEIAISIMSEILMFKLGGTGTPMKIEDKHIDRIAGKTLGQLTVSH